MKLRQRAIGWLASASLGLGLAVGTALWAQEQGGADANAQANAQAQTDPAQANEAAAPSDASGEGEDQRSRQVMEQLLQQRDQQPVDPEPAEGEGTGNEPAAQPEAQVDMPVPGVEAGQSVLGISPGQEKDQPPLLREGSFIVNRRGHLARAEDSSRLLFVFESDKKESPERPMILQACRTLESMEQIVRNRNEMVTFIISGQVHTYRGSNYLMPTMMKIAQERDNLDG
jgi:hypothetical protein